MDIDKFQENLDETFENIKSYIHLQSDLFKIIIFEKVAKVLTSFFTLIILVFVLFFIFLFLSLAFVSWYESTGGAPMDGYLLAALFYLLVGIIVFLLSKRLFLNPMIKGFSETAFEEDEDKINPNIKDGK